MATVYPSSEPEVNLISPLRSADRRRPRETDPPVFHAKPPTIPDGTDKIIRYFNDNEFLD